VSAFWQALFPSSTRCVICHRPFYGDAAAQLCNHCLSQLKFIGEPMCQICGRPLRLAAVEKGKCLLCRQYSHSFQTARSVAVYEGFWRECIHMMKYFHRHDFVGPIASLLAEVYKQFFPQAEVLLVPVPSVVRKSRRCYDHVQALALELGRQLHLPVESGNLYLKKNSAGFSYAERCQRTAGSFGVHQPQAFQDQHIILVDDILVTGRTVSECARLLISCGAKQVDVLTLAVAALEGQNLGLGKANVRR